MGADEEGTLAQLRAFRKTRVDPTIAKHRGRIVKTTGDGMLVEFASAVDATRCAVEVQRGIAGETAEVPQAKRIEFRIGIHLGDIIIDDNDIFGDGVNVAPALKAMQKRVGSACPMSANQKPTDRLDSYDHYLRAVRSRWSRLDRQGQAKKTTPSDIFKRVLGKWW